MKSRAFYQEPLLPPSYQGKAVNREEPAHDAPSPQPLNPARLDKNSDAKAPIRSG
jgi:hypothetical protein